MWLWAYVVTKPSDKEFNTYQYSYIIGFAVNDIYCLYASAAYYEIPIVKAAYETRLAVVGSEVH